LSNSASRGLAKNSNGNSLLKEISIYDSQDLKKTLSRYVKLALKPPQEGGLMNPGMVGSLS